MILVTGGTGTLGTHVVARLRRAGRPVRVLTRGNHPDGGLDAGAGGGVEYVRGDTVAGLGLTEAFAGAETVVHLAGGAKGDDVAAQNVAYAARSARADHLLLISVVGADAMPIGYFRAKAAAEETVRHAQVPYTILRAAQFHEFVARTIAPLAKWPVVPVPGGLRFEPIAATEVAERLADLVLAGPHGDVPDLVGPEVLDVREILAPLTGGHQLHIPVRIPGAIGRAYRGGDNLAAPGADRGERTWAEFVLGRGVSASA
ncbi:SDR family oxidoreductase [Pseudactinotalea sp. HY158]|uniref:SDR family oxidoreductase n=1 Tax=Pseudactinotalea sp. HY158 TaxID=2654547 RepID=UPI00129C6EA7|nr:NAD(P)H-binding protein [Pseudactinotalea sp. HY158]QGH69464.1 NAD(P)H-binding protein [Pseudactinotalea sp. HY158]